MVNEIDEFMLEGKIDVLGLFDDRAKQFIEQTTVYKPLTSSNDTIWQHMKIDYFEILLNESALYMKPVSSYSNELERNPAQYIFDPSMVITYNAYKLDSAFETLDSRSFLSCWYRSPYLADGIYNRFTKDKEGKSDPRGGIAIKTNVAKLINSIQKALIINCHYKTYYGLVQYLPRYAVNEYISPSFQKYINNSKKIDGVIPYYFKNTNLGDECEFRVLLRLFMNDEIIGESKPLVDLGLAGHSHPIDIADALEGFAIPYSFFPLKRNITELLKSKGLLALEEEKTMDKYVYYRLERDK